MRGSSESWLDSVRDVLVVDMEPLWNSERRRRGVGGTGEAVRGVSGSLAGTSPMVRVVRDQGGQGRLHHLIYSASVHCPPRSATPDSRLHS